jgi:hypothetical protein
MTLGETPGFWKKFQRTPWRFQQTFQTPLQNLQPFVTTVLSAHGPHEGASLTVDEAVFEPRHLLDLLAKHDLPAKFNRGATITATNREEVQALLQAGLADWMDFAFVPVPKPFVIYADHDEYTTLLANTKSNLNRLTTALSRQSFQPVEGYERQL